MSFPLLTTVWRTLLGKPCTHKYPSKPVKSYPRSRSKLVFHKDKCIHCSLCSKVCPTQACQFDQKTKWPSFDLNNCIMCGLCAQACPKDAIEMTNDFHTVKKDKESSKISVD